MAYEPPEYKKLKDEIWRLEKIKSFVDLARTFEHMKYQGALTVIADPRQTPFDPREGGSTVSIPDYLKVEIINAAVAWCVGQAKAVATIERQDFEIDPCIKI